MPISFPRRPISLQRTVLRGSILIAALAVVGSAAASAATTASTPLGLDAIAPAATATAALVLPGSTSSTALQPVTSCAQLDAAGMCLDAALPGMVERPLTMAALAAPPARAKRTKRWGRHRSGLNWMSGASSAGADFEAWRGRRLDVKTGYLATRRGWSELTQTLFVRRLVASGAIPVLGVGLVPESHRGQLGACAGGAFDNHIRKIGQGLVAVGARDAILRLGWEANRTGGFPWAAIGDGSAYKNCFRRWVQVLRSVPGQDFTFDFNMGAKGTLRFSQNNIYPGGDYVDVIGTQRFDRCPSIRNEADWDERYNERTAHGNPVGLGAWLAWAKSKGKRFSVPEWAVSDHHPGQHCPDNGFDNPFFIEKMHRFFRANADVMAYESYFNGGGRAYPEGVHKVFPAHNNPRAATRYRELWSRGD
jgi:hypothetical protein